MRWVPVCYPDHEVRYKHLGPIASLEFPDEVHVYRGDTLVSVVKREKKLMDLRHGDYSPRGDMGLYAKDVPLSSVKDDSYY